MAGSLDTVRNWWGTLNSMSKAELYFEKTLDAHNVISRRRPRAMLISEEPPTVREFHDPQELLDGLHIRSDVPYRPELRNLIVLEDLSREWVQALGPQLGIPVSVFALHWADPTDHVNGGLRVPIGESPARHFILSYRQSLPFFIKNRQNNITVNGVEKGQLRRRT